MRGAAVGALRAIGDVRAVDPEFAALRDEIEPLVADLGSEDRSRDAMEALVPALERSLRSIDADLLRRVNMLSDHVSFWPSSRAHSARRAAHSSHARPPPVGISVRTRVSGAGLGRPARGLPLGVGSVPGFCGLPSRRTTGASRSWVDEGPVVFPVNYRLAETSGPSLGRLAHTARQRDRPGSNAGRIPPRRRRPIQTAGMVRPSAWSAPPCRPGRRQVSRAFRSAAVDHRRA